MKVAGRNCLGLHFSTIPNFQAIPLIFLVKFTLHTKNIHKISDLLRKKTFVLKFLD
jgi:hypothetical protein